MAAAVKGLISICVVVLILASSWLIAVLINYYGGKGKELEFRTTSEGDPSPGEKLENIFWFMQISDLHISKFFQPSRVKDLEYFCNDVIDIIKPTVVMVTGDLTDAKHRDKLGSQQYEEEWAAYYSVIKKTGVELKTKWLDIRGNHDAFNVESIHSKQNYFRHFSSSGKDSSRGLLSYQYIHKTDYGQYSFNAIDTCPDPGPKRPFNFFGYIAKERMDEIKQLAEKSKSYNMTMWFGHYPFSVLTSPSLRGDVLRYGAVYFCGHLHTLGEVVPTMHAVHQDGHLELELGDWLWYRNFRVAAVDHDLFSFVDVRINEWPIILITNPKDAHYLIPAFEPTERINRSTHVRVLVFSPSSIESVTIHIDGKELQSPMVHVGGPLYVCKWEPELYQSGLHTVTINALDSDGRGSTKSQEFSLDGTRPLLALLPAIILMTDFCTLGRVSFCFAAICIVFSLYLLRHLVADEPPSGCARSFINRWFYYLVRVTKTNSLFYPLYLYGVYIVLGPWFIGEVISGHVGFMFVFGLYVYGTFIPGSFTFYYGIAQLLLFNLPLTICLAVYNSQRREQDVTRRNNGQYNASYLRRDYFATVCRIITHLVYSVLVLSQLWSSYGIFRAYGFMAFALCPVKTWSLALAGYLWYKANF